MTRQQALDEAVRRTTNAAGRKALLVLRNVPFAFDAILAEYRRIMEIEKIACPECGGEIPSFADYLKTFDCSYHVDRRIVGENGA